MNSNPSPSTPSQNPTTVDAKSAALLIGNSNTMTSNTNTNNNTNANALPGVGTLTLVGNINNPTAVVANATNQTLLLNRISTQQPHGHLSTLTHPHQNATSKPQGQMSHAQPLMELTVTPTAKLSTTKINQLPSGSSITITPLNNSNSALAGGSGVSVVTNSNAMPNSGTPQSVNTASAVLSNLNSSSSSNSASPFAPSSISGFGMSFFFLFCFVAILYGIKMRKRAKNREF